MLIEAVSQDGTAISLQLQNAETVKLVGPSCSPSSSPKSYLLQRTISVADLKVGDEVLALLQEGARHSGMSIQEFILER